jgi:exonuclease III
MEVNRNVIVATYNMHGFQQGRSCLSELLTYCDIVCTQEHWLSSLDFTRLNICDDFIVFASSAMDTACSRGILRGRPFGGLAVYIRKDLSGDFNLIAAEERFIIFHVNNVLVCNVYLPCKSVRDYDTVYLETVHDIITVIQSTTYNDFIICGDYNFMFNNRSSVSNIIHELCSTLKLHRTDVLLHTEDNYSFCSADGRSRSLIDHFLVSANILDAISDITILDSGSNLSDHRPVIASFMLQLLSTQPGNAFNTTVDGSGAFCVRRGQF